MSMWEQQKVVERITKKNDTYTIERAKIYNPSKVGTAYNNASHIENNGKLRIFVPSNKRLWYLLYSNKLFIELLTEY